MSQGKATTWLASVVILAGGLLAVSPAAHAADTGAPRVQITLTPPQGNFRSSTCSSEAYRVNESSPAAAGGLDYTVHAWHASVVVTDGAGGQVGAPYNFGSSDNPGFIFDHTFPVCPDSAAGTWTLTLSYRECAAPDLECASTDPVAAYTTRATFVVADPPPPLVTSVEVASVDYTARQAVVTSQVNAVSAASPRRPSGAGSLPAGARLIVQKKSRSGHWKNLRTVATDVSGHVTTKVKRTHRKQRVRFYLPASDTFKSSMSRAVKIKPRKD